MGCGESKHQVVDGNTITRKKSSIISRWYSRGRQETSSPDKNKGESNDKNGEAENTSSVIKQGDEDINTTNGILSGDDVKNDLHLAADVKGESEKKQVTIMEGDAKPNVVQEKNECISIPNSIPLKKLDDEKMMKVNLEETAKAEKTFDEERKEAIQPIIESGENANVLIKETEAEEVVKTIKSKEASILNVKETGEPVIVKDDTGVNKETEKEEAVNVVKETETLKVVSAEEPINVEEQAVEDNSTIKETEAQASTTPAPREEDLNEKKEEEKPADSTNEEVLENTA